MKYSLRFRREIADDILRAKNWYQTRSEGTASRFMAACKETLDLICQRPLIAAADQKGVRAKRIRRFPYVIYYRPVNDVIWIYAIEHGAIGDAHLSSRLNEGE